MVATRTERAELGRGSVRVLGRSRPARRHPDPVAPTRWRTSSWPPGSASSGLEQASLGCPVWGYERDGVLRALCHAGSNLVPVNADEAAIEAWTEFAGPQRMCASIIGPSDVAMALWRRLADRWGPTWAQTRNVRPHQPVMSISTAPSVAPDPRVRRVTLDQWDAYTDAAVKMYTEEIGVSPVLRATPPATGSTSAS